MTMRNQKLMAVNLENGNLELSFIKGVRGIKMPTNSMMMNGGTSWKETLWHHWPSQLKINYQDQEQFSISQIFLQHQSNKDIVVV